MVKVSTKWRNTCKHACFRAYSLKIYMKAQKHACFHAFSPFSGHLYRYTPHYILMDKALLFIPSQYASCGHHLHCLEKTQNHPELFEIVHKPLSGRYLPAPGPVTELSKSVSKPQVEGALVTAVPPSSREPIIIVPMQKCKLLSGSG